MRRAAIEWQNNSLLAQQRQYRMAADVVCDAWASFPEVQAVGVIGSVAKMLWKEVPRFREFRRACIEVWPECGDLDLALWITSQQRLGELRVAAVKALRAAFEAGTGVSVVGQQLDVFLFKSVSGSYVGRLCYYNQCPKDKPACRVRGCGEIPFNKRIAEFTPPADLLVGVEEAMLYRRGVGRLRSALDLPTPVEDEAPPKSPRKKPARQP